MKPEIIIFNLGLTSCYLIIVKDIVMIDAGMPNKLDQLKSDET